MVNYQILSDKNNDEVQLAPVEKKTLSLIQPHSRTDTGTSWLKRLLSACELFLTHFMTLS